MAASKHITTELQLRKLKLSSERYDIKVANVPGLVVRVGKTKSFRWDRGRGQKPRIITYGSFPEISLKQAREMHEKARQQHAAGHMHQAQAETLATVADLAEVFYRDRILPVRKRPEAVRQLLDHDILPQIGKVRLYSISTLAVRGVVKSMVDRGVKSHAAKCLAVMKQLFRFGVSIGVMDSSPAESLDKVDLGAGDRRKDRTLTRAEIKAFWEALEDLPRLSTPVRTGLQLLVLLGVRSGELRQAKWDDLDTDKALLTIPVENQKINPRQLKNAKPFVVPLDDFAMGLFERLRGFDDTWIFPGRTGGCITDKVFGRATRRLLERRPEIDPFTPHDLRRTMRTNLGRLRVQPHIAELCLGHSLGSIIDTYDTHNYLEDRRDALARWSREVQLILGLHENVVMLEVG